MYFTCIFSAAFCALTTLCCANLRIIHSINRNEGKVIYEVISDEARVCNAGVIDSQTLSVMSLSRCGVPDTGRNANRHQRHKRFVQAGKSTYTSAWYVIVVRVSKKNNSNFLELIWWAVRSNLLWVSNRKTNAARHFSIFALWFMT